MVELNFEVITIPERFDNGAIEALRERIESLRDNAPVRSVIMTGEGEAFCRGFETPLVNLTAAHALTSVIEGLGKPVIAAVNGDAIDAGLEIAIACTWRICAESAGFALTGAVPGIKAASRLSRVIGRSRTHELILTGRRIDASEALAVNLVSQVLPDRAGLMSAAQDLARHIGRNAPLAVKYALDAVNAGSEMPLEAGLRLESALFALCFATHDVREGARAFLEKRTPDFKGE